MRSKAKKRNKIKEEFESLARKIEQLKAFEKQLNSIPAKGFEKEVFVIKAKLKDINEIPEIGRLLKDLEHKIIKKEAGRGKTRIGVNKLKELGEEISELKGYVERESTREESEDLRAGRYLAEIPKLEREIELLKKEIKKDIPDVEKEILSLRKDVEGHLKSGKMKVDTGVGVAVDSSFDDFVNSLKGVISQRVQGREKELAERLRAGLAEQERKFADKYKSLVKEFERKFENKIEEELQGEVKKRFDALLIDSVRNHLEEEEKKLREKLDKEFANEIGRAKKEMAGELQSRYAAKEKELERVKKGFISSLQEEYKEKEKELIARYKDLFEDERRKFVFNFIKHMENLIIDEKEEAIAMINSKYREKEMMLKEAITRANQEFRGILHSPEKTEEDRIEIKQREIDEHLDKESFEDIMHEEEVLREKLERLLHRERNDLG